MVIDLQGRGSGARPRRLVPVTRIVSAISRSAISVSGAAAPASELGLDGSRAGAASGIRAGFSSPFFRRITNTPPGPDMASSSVCDRSCASASSSLSVPVSVSALYPAVSCSENRTGVPACAANSLRAALSGPASICMGTDNAASVSCAQAGCVPANRLASTPMAAPRPNVLVNVTDPLRSSPACPMQPATRDNKPDRREGIINGEGPCALERLALRLVCSPSFPNSSTHTPDDVASANFCLPASQPP